MQLCLDLDQSNLSDESTLLALTYEKLNSLQEMNNDRCHLDTQEITNRQSIVSQCRQPTHKQMTLTSVWNVTFQYSNRKIE